MVRDEYSQCKMSILHTLTQTQTDMYSFWIWCLEATITAQKTQSHAKTLRLTAPRAEEAHARFACVNGCSEFEFVLWSTFTCILYAHCQRNTLSHKSIRVDGERHTLEILRVLAHANMETPVSVFRHSTISADAGWCWLRRCVETLLEVRDGDKVWKMVRL